MVPNMKSTVFATLFLVASFDYGMAESCHDTFVRLLLDGNGDDPVKIHVMQKIKGAPTMTNYFYQAEPGHWQTEVIDPAGQDWVLTWNNTMYTSSDKGKSWKKLRTVDSENDRKLARKNMQENARTVENAVCGEEALGGVMHDTVEADFETLQNFKTENHHKYWLAKENGYIAKAVYQVKGKGFESVTTQQLEPAPDLTLPTPE